LKKKLTALLVAMLITATMVIGVPLNASAAEKGEDVRNHNTRDGHVRDDRDGRDGRGGHGRWTPGHYLRRSKIWVPGHWSDYHGKYHPHASK
jgi:hypothetical protein